MNIKDVIYSELKKITKVNFNGATAIKQLEIDSLDLVELITEAEESLDISISDEALAKIKTVDDIVKQFKQARA